MLTISLCFVSCFSRNINKIKKFFFIYIRILIIVAVIDHSRKFNLNSIIFCIIWDNRKISILQSTNYWYDLYMSYAHKISHNPIPEIKYTYIYIYDAENRRSILEARRWLKFFWEMPRKEPRSWKHRVRSNRIPRWRIIRTRLSQNRMK